MLLAVWSDFFHGYVNRGDPGRIALLPFEPYEKMYFWTCMLDENSDQPACPSV